MVAPMNAPKFLRKRETWFVKVLTYMLSVFVSDGYFLSIAVPWMPPTFYGQREPGQEEVHLLLSESQAEKR